MKDTTTFAGNIFAGSPLDRAGNARRDPAWVAAQAAAPDTLFLGLWRLKIPVIGNGLGWISGAEMRALAPAGAETVLLGVVEGRAHFAVDISALAGKDDPPPAGDRFTWSEARQLAQILPRGEAAIVAQARSILDWHARHGFCAVCGKPTTVKDAGYCRKCSDPACDASHFPRTDPVVIMLVAKGDNALLGRSGRFPAGFYSALAGFMEPGESIEEAVRREVMEEAGIKVGRVRYHSSQPWPYPSSLMIGCLAEAESDTIAIDNDEMEDVRWWSRAEVRAAVERSARAGTDPFAQRTPPETTGLIAPAPMAIAHQLMRWWSIDEAND